MITVDFDIVKKAVPDIIDYCDDEILFLSNFRQAPELLVINQIKMNLYFVVVCLEGKFQLKVNEKQVVAEQNCILFCDYGSVVQDFMFSADFEGICLILSNMSICGNFADEAQLLKLHNFVSKHNVIRLNSEDMSLINSYLDLIRRNYQNREKLMYRKIINLLEYACTLEFVSIFERIIPKDEFSNTNSGSNDIVSRFLAELALGQGRIHTVNEIADKLHVTSKYLGTIVSKSTNKTALKWIHETLLNETIRRLKFTTDSIKVISEDLKYPNVSFFGKFVKSHTGKTPVEIRREK